MNHISSHHAPTPKEERDALDTIDNLPEPWKGLWLQALIPGPDVNEMPVWLDNLLAILFLVGWLAAELLFLGLGVAVFFAAVS